MASLPPPSNQVPSFLPPQGPTPSAMYPPTHAGQTPGNPPPFLPPPLCYQPIEPPVTGGGGQPRADLIPPILEPVDDCMRSVRADQVIPGARVDIFLNGVLAGSIVAPQNLVFPATVDIPLPNCSLRVGDLLQTIQTLGINDSKASILFTGIRVASHSQFDCLTQHYDNARTGWFQYEKQLTVASLAPKSTTFKNQFNLPVDAKVYAQPLYMHQQFFPTLQEAHNAVFLATEKDTVYAYDADDPNAVLLWQRSLLPPGETYVNTHDVYGFGNEDVAPTIGITGTPVIDCGCGCSCESHCECDCGCGCHSGAVSNAYRPPTMFVVAKTKRTSDSTYHQYLHALDIRTGLDLPNSPVEIEGSVIGTGGGSTGTRLSFDPWLHFNRPALLLVRGTVYVGFCGHGDTNGGQQHGWMFSFDVNTLLQKNIFCTTPDGSIGGVWMSGCGPASDGESIFFSSGDGTFDASNSGVDYGDTVLKVRCDLAVTSWFSPASQAALHSDDLDLASGGVLIVPGKQVNSPENLLIACGKAGEVYLLNSDSLGGFAGPAPTSPDLYGTNPNAINVTWLDSSISATSVVGFHGVFGGPAFCKLPNPKTGALEQLIYYCPGSVKGPIAFLLQNGRLIKNMSASDTFNKLGATPVISSNGIVKGTAVLWAIARAGTSDLNLYLRAYDASNLSPLYPGVDGWLVGTWTELPTPLGNDNAFIEPTVINGKVYAGTDSYVAVFGL